MRRILAVAVTLLAGLTAWSPDAKGDADDNRVTRRQPARDSYRETDGLDPSLAGPYAIDVETFDEGAHGAVTTFDLYYPRETGLYPGIVLGHGFSQGKAYQSDNGEQLASWGFVVLVPTFSTFADHEANAEEMLVLSDWLVSDENPIRRRVDETRLGLAGHSAGGLATTIAAGMDARSSRQISAIIGLDAVDAVTGDRSTGIPYAQDIVAPAFYLSGIPYSCNGYGNAQSLYDAIPISTEKMFLRITEAVHCDFNTQGLDHACTPGVEPEPLTKVVRLLFTQGWPAAYDAATAGVCSVDGQELDRTESIRLVRQYLTAWFLSQLAHQTWADAYLFDGNALSEDLDAGVVEDLQY